MPVKLVLMKALAIFLKRGEIFQKLQQPVTLLKLLLKIQAFFCHILRTIPKTFDHFLLKIHPVHFSKSHCMIQTHMFFKR